MDTTQNNETLLRSLDINEYLENASHLSQPLMLWRDLWVESEACCLFADSNVGKSILATQIAIDIAEAGKRVIYLDFELTPQQFYQRCADPDTGKVYHIDGCMYRSWIDPERYTDMSISEILLKELHHVGRNDVADVVIIDNISFLNTSTEEADEAIYLMRQLMALKHKFGLSVMVIAHTPKRDFTQPLSQNDLAGSKKLFNFFDSVIGMAESKAHQGVRYIKQLKVRAGERVYTDNNVLTCSLVRRNGLLQFEFGECTEEREQLHQPRLSLKERDEKIMEMTHAGATKSEIALALGVSGATIKRVRAANRRSGDDTPVCTD